LCDKHTFPFLKSPKRRTRHYPKKREESEKKKKRKTDRKCFSVNGRCWRRLSFNLDDFGRFRSSSSAMTIARDWKGKGEKEKKRKKKKKRERQEDRFS